MTTLSIARRSTDTANRIGKLCSSVHDHTQEEKIRQGVIYRVNVPSHEVISQVAGHSVTGVQEEQNSPSKESHLVSSKLCSFLFLFIRNNGRQQHVNVENLTTNEASVR